MTSISQSSTTTSITTITFHGCSKFDNRGEWWSVPSGETGKHMCPEGANPGGKANASWECEGKMFRTPQPDRSLCVHQWIEDVNDMVNIYHMNIIRFINHNCVTKSS